MRKKERGRREKKEKHWKKNGQKRYCVCAVLRLSFCVQRVKWLWCGLDCCGTLIVVHVRAWNRKKTTATKMGYLRCQPLVACHVIPEMVSVRSPHSDMDGLFPACSTINGSTGESIVFDCFLRGFSHVGLGRYETICLFVVFDCILNCHFCPAPFTDSNSENNYVRSMSLFKVVSRYPSDSMNFTSERG